MTKRTTTADGIQFGALPGILVVLAAGLTLTAAGCERSEGTSPPGDRAGLTGGELVLEDDFSGEELAQHWGPVPDAWRLQDGGLHVADARNDALWLNEPLPEQVRVEFDVVAHHTDGDLKFEIFGNGRDHESGYIAIYGGWQNSTTCIARRDEHGSDRLDAEAHHPVQPERTYHFAVVRTDRRLRWFIDGEHVLTFDDASPLEGRAHRFFAFNNWAAAASFDNLRVYDLSN